jgi:hypothetical protein
MLSEIERHSWRLFLGLKTKLSPASAAVLDKARNYAGGTIEQAKREGQNNRYFSRMTVAIDHLTLSRILLYQAITGISSNDPKINESVNLLRNSNRIDHFPRGLLTRAWLRSIAGLHTGIESAQADLDEAWEIAERGPMKLHMADIHLHRARLFFREKPYPWKSPQDDLAAAEKLINDCGYHRRDEELADAKQAILS